MSSASAFRFCEPANEYALPPSLVRKRRSRFKLQGDTQKVHHRPHMLNIDICSITFLSLMIIESGMTDALVIAAIVFTHCGDYWLHISAR